MARDVGLGDTDRVGELADAELVVPAKQDQAAQPGLVGKGPEEVGRLKLHGTNRQGKTRLVPSAPPRLVGSDGTPPSLPMGRAERAIGHRAPEDDSTRAFL